MVLEAMARLIHGDCNGRTSLLCGVFSSQSCFGLDDPIRVGDRCGLWWGQGLCGASVLYLLGAGMAGTALQAASTAGAAGKQGAAGPSHSDGWPSHMLEAAR